MTRLERRASAEVRGERTFLSEDNLEILIYDGQLKKFLAYVAVAISAIVPQLTLFAVLASRDTPLHGGAVFPIVSMATMLLFLEIALTIVVVAKFDDLVILEKRLGITEFYRKVKGDKSGFARLWDTGFRYLLGLREADLRRGAYDSKRIRGINRFLDIGTIVVLVLLLTLYGFILFLVSL